MKNLTNINKFQFFPFHLVTPSPWPATFFKNLLKWVKLSNSGDTLKFSVPNYIRKYISGWTNYSGKVTNTKMIENEIGYRGSKSVLYSSTVKEQRVYGNWWIRPIHLRYTLMGCENSYQIKIFSKQLNKRNYYINSNSLSKLNPWFITGLIDGEGSFYTTIFRNNEYKLGWQVQSIFSITLHSRDEYLLLQLQQYFCGIGSLIRQNNYVKYSVAGIKDLKTIIIPHFEKYKLLTQKGADFILFNRIIEIMNNNGHLTLDGLYKIINIKASMNFGIKNNLKKEFNKITPVERQIIYTNNIPNPNWLSGFITGEGNFQVWIGDSKSHKLKYQVQLMFRIGQHEKDKKLMELLIKYLSAGKLYKNSKEPFVNLTIYKFTEIKKIIIPFFEKNPLYGVKHLDFLKFCQIAKLMVEKKHLTLEGLNQIREIKSRMNKYI
jgi:hypothetical protein